MLVELQSIDDKLIQFSLIKNMDYFREHNITNIILE